MNWVIFVVWFMFVGFLLGCYWSNNFLIIVFLLDLDSFYVVFSFCFILVLIVFKLVLENGIFLVLNSLSFFDWFLILWINLNNCIEYILILFFLLNIMYVGNIFDVDFFFLIIWIYINFDLNILILLLFLMFVNGLIFLYVVIFFLENL